MAVYFPLDNRPVLPFAGGLEAHPVLLPGGNDTWEGRWNCHKLRVTSSNPMGYEVLEVTVGRRGRKRRILLRIDRLDESVVTIDDVARASEVVWPGAGPTRPVREPVCPRGRVARTGPTIVHNPPFRTLPRSARQRPDRRRDVPRHYSCCRWQPGDLRHRRPPSGCPGARNRQSATRRVAGVAALKIKPELPR